MVRQYLDALVAVIQPRQSYIFETLKVNAGSHTWEEKMRLLEEGYLFKGREIMLIGRVSSRNIRDYIR